MTSERTSDGELLRQFASGDSVGSQIAAARELVNAKRIFAVLDSPEFALGVERLKRGSAIGADPQDRLRAVSMLELIRAIAKKKSKPVIQAVKDSLVDPLPPVNLLVDGNERYYIASAIEFVRPSWAREYVAREAMAEPTAEKAREKLISTLIGESVGLDDALRSLTTNINAIRVTENPSESTAKLLRRVVAATCAATAAYGPAPGPEIGRQLRDLLAHSFEKCGPPQDVKVIQALTEEVAHLITAIVRTRFSLMLDRTIYSSLSSCKRWFLASGWNTFVTRSKAIADVKRVVIDAIRLSARLGIRDEGLFDVLDLCTGTRERSLQHTRAILEEMAGATPAVQSWLKTGRVSKEDDADFDSEQGQLLEADRYIARALLVLADEKKTRSNASSSENENANAYFDQLATAVTAVADQRGIRLFGDPGETIPFSPVEHAMVQGEGGAAQVKVARPGVVRRDTSGRLHIVVRAIVTSQ
ncbi:MAG: hypothetical protein Q7S69_02935 [Nitrosomonadaceae bacterium]|nr:hypothetical protein [Nitrosomonadaceae bacterium]